MPPRPVADRLQKNSVFLRIQVLASSQTKGLERDWGLWACEARVLRACETLKLRETDFEKKTRLFCSLLGEFVLGSPRVQIVDHGCKDF